jgi:hypothetical protein
MATGIFFPGTMLELLREADTTGAEKRGTWLHEKLGKSGSGDLLYRYKRYGI